MNTKKYMEKISYTKTLLPFIIIFIIIYLLLLFIQFDGLLLKDIGYRIMQIAISLFSSFIYIVVSGIHDNDVVIYEEVISKKEKIEIKNNELKEELILLKKSHELLKEINEYKKNFK